MKPLSKKWTSDDRLRVVAALLPDIQADIYSGRYSEVGRANITTLQHILFDSREDLESYRPKIEPLVSKYEKILRRAPGREVRLPRRPQIDE